MYNADENEHDDHDHEDDHLINVRLRRKPASIKLTPRSYQREFLRKALQENTIIYLGTGLGKTFIVVMFLNHPKIYQEIQNRRKVVFLACSRDLIKQQAEYINNQVSYRVKVYCGGSGLGGLHIDHWSQDAWREEFRTIDILFMTPQIFLMALTLKRIDWGQIAAVIFDECHNAASKSKGGSSPYRKIMEHYHEHFASGLATLLVKPRIIGLTASLVNDMPKSTSREYVRNQVDDLERLFAAKCVTDLQVRETKPRIVVQKFSASNLTVQNDLLLNFFEITEQLIKQAVEAAKLRVPRYHNRARGAPSETAYERELKLAKIGITIKPEDFSPIFKDLAKIRCDYGIWILSSICQRLVDALTGSYNFNSRQANATALSIYGDFVGLLRKVCSYIDEFLKTHEEGGLLQQTSSKPKALLYNLEREAERAKNDPEATFSCVIFVSNRLEVVALTEWLQRLSETCGEKYGFIKCNWAVGLSAAQTTRYSCVTKRNPNKQAQMLQDFRDGNLNVIVTTSVLEEGIDLPVCSSVIRYDEVQNFRQHVQSRGRARQAISSFILMCEERDSQKLINGLKKFNEFELAVKETLRQNDIRPSGLTIEANNRINSNNSGSFLIGEHDEEPAIPIYSKPTAVLRAVLDRYLSHKSRQTPFTGGLSFERFKRADLFQTKLYFPSGCPLSEGIEGSPRRTIKQADNAVLIAAIERLHELNELNDNNVPTWLETSNIDTYLAECNLEPKFEKLDKRLEGIQIKTIDKASKSVKVKTYFKPCVDVFKRLCLSNNIEKRTYRLLRISYQADPQNSRFETRHLFEKSVFGLIIDETISCDFIPSALYSHYGQFEVKAEQILSNFKMNDPEEHSKCLGFTHKLLSNCLSFNDISKEDLNCIFYLVALNSNTNLLDMEKMRQSFGDENKRIENYQTAALQPGNVVRFARASSAGGGGQIGADDEQSKLMLVRTLVSGVSVDLIGLGGISHRQRAERRLGRTIDSQQKLVEVIAISPEFARLELGKKAPSDYQSQSLFYLEQELELFDRDGAYVFQAFNKPAIIHSLFLQTMAAELDKQLSNGSTGALERNTASSAAAAAGEPEVSREERICNQFGGSASITSAEEPESPMMGVSTEHLSTPTSVVDHLEGDKQMEADGFFEEEEEPKEKFELLEPTHKVTAEEFYYANPHLDFESQAQDAQLFKKLIADVESDRLKFVEKLKHFDLRSVDVRLDYDESALFHRSAKVDRSIKAPLKFDRNPRPLRVATRSRSLLEALTLSRALGSINYECLENIGDSFIKQAVSVVLFLATKGDEGFLTSARSRLIANKYFTHLAKRNNLGAFAVTRPFGKDQLAFFMGKETTSANDKGDSPAASSTVETYYNRLEEKNLADLVESIIGSRLVYHGEYEAMRTMQALGLHIFENSVFLEFNKEAVVFAKAPTALYKELSQLSEIVELDYQSLTLKLGTFEKVLGYKFNDISYLVQAFTHSSAITKYTKSYERLEFIGDSLLDYLITIHLVSFGSEKVRENPGQITMSRSALVNNYSFAKMALKYTFDLFILHGSHSIMESLNKVLAAIEEDPEMRFLDMVKYDEIVKLLGDVFESVAAAIYLDSGNSLDTLWSVYYPMMRDSIESEIKCPTRNLIAALYEAFPIGKDGAKRIIFNYYATEKKFEEHLTRSVCTIVGYRSFEGKGLTKNQAKLRAVKEAMEALPDKETRDRLNSKLSQNF